MIKLDHIINDSRFYKIFLISLFYFILNNISCHTQTNSENPRLHILLNDNWKFFKYDSITAPDGLIYDKRPEVSNFKDSKDADSKPLEAVKLNSETGVLKSWILPSANSFIADSTLWYKRPMENPGFDFPFVQNNFNDGSWQNVTLPHDWAINGPFQKGPNPVVGGGMGRLPSPGVGWYRRKLDIPKNYAGKDIFLDIEGAMSYCMVWINGYLAGGWPYGYNSFRINLTPYIKCGSENQLAIRLDNPNNSSRWYPGGGLYRNVWLTVVHPVHVVFSGTKVTTCDVSKNSAKIKLDIKVESTQNIALKLETQTFIYLLDSALHKTGPVVSASEKQTSEIPAGKFIKIENNAVVNNPKLWGPFPQQTPWLYTAVTTIKVKGKIVDEYETRFGIRSLEFNADKGFIVNGQPIFLKGVNQHHDLGALGAAFNRRAAQRQLEILREMGCNAIRFSHNPPSPELLELTDQMGFLVIDEIFDSWERFKTPNDFHLIFEDWSEPDLRAFIRRDQNCPSVIMWSFGNEVGEQYTGAEGANVARRLYKIIREEDEIRPVTLAMNYAKPDMALPDVPDVIGLNYQGEGIRQSSEFEGTERIRTTPQYDAYHTRFPGKMILSTETASAASSRGIYLFPVTKYISSPIRDGRGGDSKIYQVSSYELYAVDFGSSADKVFASLDKHPFVAGEFVWNGFDYLGEPTPYYESRSSYTGILDLAGFKKDRFYLYQSHWRPEYPMAHILPHWNWPGREGEITPVHVFTSGDEAELFLNGKTMGRLKKQDFEYRLRWDSIKYEPGIIKVISYKYGKKWACDSVCTTGPAYAIKLTADRPVISADGCDLCFITATIVDNIGFVVPLANEPVSFSVEGFGEIEATDNGDPTNMDSFSAQQRNAFNGLCLAIVKAQAGKSGKLKIMAKSPNLKLAEIEISVK